MRRSDFSYALAVLLIIASCLVVSAARFADRTKGAPHSPAPEIVVPVIPDVPSEDSASFAPLSERPLFVATRRPQPPAPVEAKPESVVVAAPTISVTLLGTMLSAAQRWVLVKQGNDVSQVTVGQSIDGWVLEDVKQSSATFRSGDRKQTIYLPDSVPQGAAGQ